MHPITVATFDTNKGVYIDLPCPLHRLYEFAELEEPMFNFGDLNETCLRFYRSSSFLRTGNRKVRHEDLIFRFLSQVYQIVSGRFASGGFSLGPTRCVWGLFHDLELSLRWIRPADFVDMDDFFGAWLLGGVVD